MSPRLPALRPAEVQSILERAGFELHHSTGSHRIFKHPERAEIRVTVPFHSRDLKIGTLRAIIRQSGMTVEEFLALR